MNNLKLTLEEKEIKYSKGLPLGFPEDIKIKSLGDIIYNLFFSENRKNTEYKYKYTTRKQITGSARSIEDCFKIAKYYFPKITYKQVQDAVECYYFNYDGKRRMDDTPKLRNSYCTTVKRIVHSNLNNPSKISVVKFLNNKILNYETV